ncbi:unnamed protein product [Mytilus edulis]|uniref:Uncharacterized protein n=1 Tax=Mytilus edulis TaxID=6550 RepID=A0A8S3VMH7_MYTED|nr:unnamed protein product [Mytilus edulis]
MQATNNHSLQMQPPPIIHYRYNHHHSCTTDTACTNHYRIQPPPITYLKTDLQSCSWIQPPPIMDCRSSHPPSGLILLHMIGYRSTASHYCGCSHRRFMDYRIDRNSHGLRIQAPPSPDYRCNHHDHGLDAIPPVILHGYSRSRTSGYNNSHSLQMQYHQSYYGYNHLTNHALQIQPPPVMHCSYSHHDHATDTATCNHTTDTTTTSHE